MIVRNEAEMLPGFLRCAHGLWDEMCVVDTGSSDETVAILAKAGARVRHLAWGDDFAEARNAALDMATQPWVVSLDADEMVTSDLVRQVRDLGCDPTAGAATVVMRNPLPSGHTRQSHLLRVWRHDAAIRFRHAIHEDVTADVRDMLARTGQRIVHLPGVVDHLGYVRKRAAAKGKKDRDSTILRRCIRADPDDLYNHFKLLELARFWGDADLWTDAAREAYAALSRANLATLKTNHFSGDLIALVDQGGMAGQGLRARLAWMNGWGSHIADSAVYLYSRGELKERAGDLADAALDFTACLALARTTPDRQMATVRPRLGLARVCLAQGRVSSAWEHVGEALSCNPRDPETLLAALFIRKATMGQPGIDGFVSQYVAEYGRTPELDAALTETGASLTKQPGQRPEIVSSGAP